MILHGTCTDLQRKHDCGGRSGSLVPIAAWPQRRISGTRILLLNTPGGVVDLCSGEVHPHQPIRYMTKITAVEPIGPCPQWRRFLDRIFAGDGRTDGAQCAKNKK